MFIYEKNPKNLQKPVEYTRYDGIVYTMLANAFQQNHVKHLHYTIVYLGLPPRIWSLIFFQS